MKKIILSLFVIAFLSSCSSTSKTSNSSSDLAVMNGTVNVANTVAEINNLLNTLNLSFSQSTQIGSIIGSYVTQYNSLADVDINSQSYKSQIKKYKSNTLSSISNVLNPNQYNNFINSLIFATNSNSTNLSSGTVAVLSSLVK